MDKQFHKAFDQCPNCGCTQQFMKELGKELKARGFARQEWNLRYSVGEGVPTDKSFTGSIPVGTLLAGFNIMTDICMDCGTIYAVELQRVEGKGEVRRRSGLQLPGEPRLPDTPFSTS